MNLRKNLEKFGKISKVNYLGQRTKNLAAVFATSVALGLSGCGEADEIQPNK